MISRKVGRRDRPPDNPEVREEMKAIASKQRRFGYRRIGVLLDPKAMIMGHSLGNHGPSGATEAR